MKLPVTVQQLNNGNWTVMDDEHEDVAICYQHAHASRVAEALNRGPQCVAIYGDFRAEGSLQAVQALVQEHLAAQKDARGGTPANVGTIELPYAYAYETKSGTTWDIVPNYKRYTAKAVIRDQLHEIPLYPKDAK